MKSNKIIAIEKRITQTKERIETHKNTVSSLESQLKDLLKQKQNLELDELKAFMNTHNMSALDAIDILEQMKGELSNEEDTNDIADM